MPKLTDQELHDLALGFIHASPKVRDMAADLLETRQRLEQADVALNEIANICENPDNRTKHTLLQECKLLNEIHLIVERGRYDLPVITSYDLPPLPQGGQNE